MEKNQTDPSAVVKSIAVERDIASSFRIWTEEIDGWWPRTHTISQDPKTIVTIEGKVGGRFFERTSQDVEHDWGSVVAWEPPNHFAYLWYLGSGQQLPTRVEVNFVELDKNRTRVDVIHRGPELIGELWGTNKGRYSMSWDSVLAELVKFCLNRA